MAADLQQKMAALQNLIQNGGAPANPPMDSVGRPPQQGGQGAISTIGTQVPPQAPPVQTTPEQERRKKLVEDGFRPHDPHKGTFGICAPSSEAGDQRALIARPFGTIAHILDHAVTAGPTSSGVFTPVRSSYTLLEEGRSDRGLLVGIDDPLSEGETSFYSDNNRAAPFRDYDFVVSAVSVIPDGLPIRPGYYNNSAPLTLPTVAPANNSAVVSLGTGQVVNGQSFSSPNLVAAGAAATGIPVTVARLLSAAIVAQFFNYYSMQLGFKNESARWELSVPMMSPGGIGLFGGALPSNADPVTGKYIPLPFSFQLPRAYLTGTSMAQFFFNRMDANLAPAVAIDPALLVRVGAAGVATAILQNNTENWADVNALVQIFKVALIGRRLCSQDSIASEIATLMSTAGCSRDVAEKLCSALHGVK